MAAQTHWFCVTLALALFCAPGMADDAGETYGCEANPTGNPIGGGAGYSETVSTGDFTVRTKEELRAALNAAETGQVVFVPAEAEIDLTGEAAVAVPGGVTLASSRGFNGSPGARLYSTEYIRPMLRSDGDEVRVTGLRIEGPEPNTDSAGASYGIQFDHFGCEADNCEVYNWGYVGVGGRGCKLKVHHNTIHHCQRKGLGYGVATNSSEAFIYANRFDYTRHAIASSGAPGAGYEAAWNLVGPNSTSHYFDIHGGSDRGDATLIAGDWLLIHHNTFLGTARAVCIRGIPSQEARIHHNWFTREPGAHGTVVYSWGNTLVYRNAHGPDKVLQPAPYSLTVDCHFLDPDTYYTLGSGLSFAQ